MVRNYTLYSTSVGGVGSLCRLAVLNLPALVVSFALALAAAAPIAHAISGEIQTGPLLADDGNDFDFGLLLDIQYTELANGEAFPSGDARDEFDQFGSPVVPPIDAGVAKIISDENLVVIPNGEGFVLEENVTVNATNIMHWTCGLVVGAAQNPFTCLLGATVKGAFQIKQGKIVVKKRGRNDYIKITQCDVAAQECIADSDKFSAFNASLSPDLGGFGSVAFYNNLLPENIDKLEILVAFSNTNTGEPESVEVLTSVPDVGTGASVSIADGPVLLAGVKLAPPNYLFSVATPFCRLAALNYC